ncbi:MAG: DUF2971 domain-containing protein [Bacteroidota bacterium]
MSFSSNPLYLHDPIYTSQPIQGSIDDYLKNWLSNHELSSEDELFHYTSLEGLKGILSTRSLWFSHASTLNDPLELQYGRQLIKDVINENINSDIDESLRTFYHQLKVQLNTMGELVHHPFITCFCEEGDLLSQWRSYAKEGVGYSIGFKFSSDTHLATNINELDESKPIFLRKVIYQPEKQRKLIQTYLDQVVPIAIEEIKDIQKDKKDSHPAAVLGIQASNPLIDLMLSFKHPAFHEEKEWRLIRVTRENYDTKNLKFREDESNLIPYRSMHVYDKNDNENFFPCTSIINGPSSNTDNKASIKLYLQHLSSKEHPILIYPRNIAFKNAGYSLR